jgi:hypothetical protein
LFSAVPPDQAVHSYLAHRAAALQMELADQSRSGNALVEELMSSYAQGQGEQGTLDYLRIVSDPMQAAARFRKLLGGAKREYMEFSRPPYAADPMEVAQVMEARQRGVHCRVLVEQGTLDAAHQRFLADYAKAGVEVRQIGKVPMKMAVMDKRHGLLALVDPVITKPAWTSLVFEHEGMAEAMCNLFEDYWRRASSSPASGNHAPGSGKP